MDKELKIYPSSSGFMTGTAYEVEYNSACLRYLLVSQGIPKSIDPIYQLLGAAHEDWYSEKMKDEILYREKPIVKYYGKIKYSGRMDFVMTNGEIHETKASLSKSFYQTVIKKKEIKLSHLAQLISYLIHTGTHSGKIIAGFYKESQNKELLLVDSVEFIVNIMSDGTIQVNGATHYYNVKDAMSFLLKLIQVLESGEIGPRPLALNAWKNPCKFCPLKNVCDSYDKTGMSDDQFKKTAINTLKGVIDVDSKI